MYAYKLATKSGQVLGSYFVGLNHVSHIVEFYSTKSNQVEWMTFGRDFDEYVDFFTKCQPEDAYNVIIRKNDLNTCGDAIRAEVSCYDLSNQPVNLAFYCIDFSSKNTVFLQIPQLSSTLHTLKGNTWHIKMFQDSYPFMEFKSVEGNEICTIAVDMDENDFIQHPVLGQYFTVHLPDAQGDLYFITVDVNNPTPVPSVIAASAVNVVQLEFSRPVTFIEVRRALLDLGYDGEDWETIKHSDGTHNDEMPTDTWIVKFADNVNINRILQIGSGTDDIQEE